MGLCRLTLLKEDDSTSGLNLLTPHPQEATNSKLNRQVSPCLIKERCVGSITVRRPRQEKGLRESQYPFGILQSIYV